MILKKGEQIGPPAFFQRHGWYQFVFDVDSIMIFLKTSTAFTAEVSGKLNSRISTFSRKLGSAFIAESRGIKHSLPFVRSLLTMKTLSKYPETFDYATKPPA